MSVMRAPRVAVFDVGNVLIRWEPERVFRPLLPDDAAVVAFLHEVDFHAWNREQDRGRDVDDGTELLAAQFPHRAALIRRYRPRYQESVTGAIAGSVALLEALRARGPVYAITNYNQVFFRETQARFPFLTSFADVVVSGEERLLKPEPAIYETLLRRNGLRADECLFIDDSAENVAGARAIGMHATQFTSPEALAETLRHAGLLP
jgi:2-haloacid dehalogenase